MNANLSIERITYNCFYDPNGNYFMGVDTYDERSMAICVMKRTSKGVEICYIGKARNKVDFENEVKTIAAFYHIPENQILKES